MEMLDNTDNHQIDVILNNYKAGDSEAKILLERFLTKLEFSVPEKSVQHTESSLIFTDIVGSSSVFDVYGDQYGRNLVSIHDDIVNEAIKKCGGKYVKHTGDGILASFESCGRSVKSSMEILKKLNEHNEKYPLIPLSIRIGINIGSILVEDKDVYGSCVNLAARVCDLAGSNKVFTTGIVHSRCLGKGYNFVPRGKYEMKGFRNHIPIYEVVY